MKVIVLFKDGFEELEALSPVDVLRRAGVDVVMVGMDQEVVTVYIKGYMYKDRVLRPAMVIVNKLEKKEEE